jgi:glucose-1-phosphate cytidylyltransferase
MNYNFLKYIKDDNSYLERAPLQIVAKIKKLAAFKHRSFWQCMDTKRDMDKLNKLALLKKVPWLI